MKLKLLKLTGAAVLLSLPNVQPATAQLGLQFPDATPNSLAFSSTVSQGAVGFNDTTATPGEGAGWGHVITSQNVNPPGSWAYYYVTGSERGPQPVQNTATAQLAGINGFATFSAFVAGNTLNLSDFTYVFGQKNLNAYADTWSLGADSLGVNYWQSPASTIEERIYTANPNDVVVGIEYQNTPWVTFDYTDFFLIIDYKTSLADDDELKAYSNPVAASAVDGLDGDALGAATAFLADVGANGGLVQLRFDTAEPAIQHGFSGDYTGANFTFGGTIQVVPEPSTTFLLAGALGGIAVACRRRKR